MQLRPRHYVLIVIILGLGAFNLLRRHETLPGHTAAPSARGISPVWAYYDRAASLRDAPDAQFQPAVDSLMQNIRGANGVAIPPQTSPGELADLRGCRTWLLFYRQSHAGGGAQANWLQRSREHVDSCVAHHHDIPV